MCVFIDHSVRQLPGRVYTLAVDWRRGQDTPFFIFFFGGFLFTTRHPQTQRVLGFPVSPGVEKSDQGSALTSSACPGPDFREREVSWICSHKQKNNKVVKTHPIHSGLPRLRWRPERPRDSTAKEINYGKTSGCQRSRKSRE